MIEMRETEEEKKEREYILKRPYSSDLKYWIKWECNDMMSQWRPTETEPNKLQKKPEGEKKFGWRCSFAYYFA